MISESYIKNFEEKKYVIPKAVSTGFSQNISGVSIDCLCASTHGFCHDSHPF